MVMVSKGDMPGSVISRQISGAEWARKRCACRHKKKDCGVERQYRCGSVDSGSNKSLTKLLIKFLMLLPREQV